MSSSHRYQSINFNIKNKSQTKIKFVQSETAIYFTLIIGICKKTTYIRIFDGKLLLEGDFFCYLNAVNNKLQMRYIQ